jgi:oligopeptide/dipeptide ABC transporter ATP-binding protein
MDDHCNHKRDLLNVRNLKTYLYTRRGVVKAVDSINLQIGQGEWVGLVGETGCGKTMTALSILRLLPTTARVEGEILFKGKNLLKFSERNMKDVRGKEISIVFQDPLTFLNPVLSVQDQIAEALRLDGDMGKREANMRVVELLQKVRLPSPSRVARSYPHQLSGGMRQRVLIAIALSRGPSLIIADEPTTALDVTVQAQVLDLIKSLLEESHRSMLLITHDLGIVAEMCDRVYVMYGGRIVENADVFTLYERALHPYTTSLLKCVLTINEMKTRLIGIDGTVPDLVNPHSGCRFHPRCPEAKEVCLKTDPPNVEIEPGHMVSCWLYD